jgi:hypothetical protein
MNLFLFILLKKIQLKNILPPQSIQLSLYIVAEPVFLYLYSTESVL